MKNTFTLLLAIAAISLPFVGTESTQTTSNNSKPVDLCSQPARGPIFPQGSETKSSSTSTSAPTINVAGVGRVAPDFEANAYVDGGFKPIKLSSYRGKWVVLCFYPGDFTFV